MLKFECWYSIAKSNYWNLIEKYQVHQNAEIWVKREDWSKCQNLCERGESIRFKFEDKVGNQSKCWNLSANGQIDQNVKILVKRQ